MTEQRSSERLRQERETFDQLKAHDAIWFKLKLAAGATAILGFAAILLVAAFILLQPTRYSADMLALGAYAMIADIVALIGVTIGMIFKDGSRNLGPITDADKE